jgi:hypothetical protein
MRRGSPFILAWFKKAKPAQHRSNPFRVIATPKAKQDFSENGADQGGAIVVQQHIHGGLIAGLRPVKERHPDAGILFASQN